MTTQEVNELRAEISWFAMRLGEVHKQRIEAETAARALAARVKVLEEALQPFARNVFGGNQHAEALKQARAALEHQQKGEKL